MQKIFLPIKALKAIKLNKTKGIYTPQRFFSFNFTQLQKIEKTIKLEEENQSFSFFNMFKETYLSKPAYSLGKELFEYILNENHIEEEFPIVKQNEEININIMVLHVILLLYRLSLERNSYAQKEASILQYYCKSNFFVDFAAKHNDHMPVEDFANEFIENYAKRVDLFSNELFPILEELSHKKGNAVFLETEKNRIKAFLRKNIFMFEVSEKDEYLEKLYKYLIAHRNYLISLNYKDMVTYKIYWGFSKDTMLLEHFTNPNEEAKNSESSPESK